MADRVEFVDSIASFPTILLNLNDESTWWTREFDAPPPRKRRSVSSNAMRDGVHVSSSTYDARVLTLTLDLRTSTQDLNATELQKLARILDQPSILKYRPDTATSPVFFKVYPSDLAAVVDMRASAAYRQLTIELYAEPFALGLRESLAIGAVANTAPYFDVASASIKGDVESPIVLVDGTPTPSTTTAAAYRFNWQVARTTREAASQPTVVQCESLTLGVDTAISGGNARHTPTTTNFALRMTYAPTGATARAMRGSYRLYAAVSMNSGTAGATLTASVKYGSTGTTAGLTNGVTYTQAFDPTGSERWLADLGTVSFDSATAVDPAPRIEVWASVSTTTGPPTVDWDFLVLVPVDEARGVVGWDSSTAGGPTLGTALVLDGGLDNEDDRVYSATSTLIFNTAVVHYEEFALSGAIPTLVPNKANRFVYLRYSTLTGAPPSTGFNNAASGSLTLYYHPRYVHVRPSTT